MLCPPLEESGNPVVCYPVAGYPLGVKAKWEPVQEGSGTPSPENIRPIKGRDSVTVERCGKNLLKNKGNKTINGIEWTFDDQGLISIKGTIRQNLSDYFFWGGTVENAEAFTTHVDLVLSSNYITNNPNCIFGARTDAGLLQNGGKLEHVSIPSGTRIYGVFMRVLNATVDYSRIYAQLELGTTAPTTYTPYIGQTNTLTLPETVYGGEVDAVTGEGQKVWKSVALDGTENWNTWGVNKKNTNVTGFFTYDINDYSNDGSNIDKILCSTMSNEEKNIWGGKDIGVGLAGSGSSKYLIYCITTNTLPDTTDDKKAIASFKTFLANLYAAGTPVQVAYKLATQTPFTATGAQPMPALAGANTVLTDADSATVTGRADPIKRITDLEDAVASQT